MIVKIVSNLDKFHNFEMYDIPSVPCRGDMIEVDKLLFEVYQVTWVKESKYDEYSVYAEVEVNVPKHLYIDGVLLEGIRKLYF